MVMVVPRMTLPTRYEEDTNTTAASDVALLRMKSGKWRHGTSPAR
jgi:hypothetical protein